MFMLWNIVFNLCIFHELLLNNHQRFQLSINYNHRLSQVKCYFTLFMLFVAECARQERAMVC